MIPFDVTFLRPDSVEEVAQALQEARRTGARAAYFGGGTEIVTLARENKLRAEILLDYKTLSQARREPGGSSFSQAQAQAQAQAQERLAWGSALRLNEVSDGGACLLLAMCCNGVADRTVRNSITLGGNICGMLPYREAVLPFLLLQGELESLAEPGSLTWSSVEERFSKRLKLEEGELALSFSLESALVAGLESDGVIHLENAPGRVTALARGDRGGWFYERRTTGGPVDYPLSTLVLVQLDGRYRLALTGVFGYPLRAFRAEEVLNSGFSGDFASPTEADRLQRAGAALDAEGLKYKADLRGARDYRRSVALQGLAAGMEALA
ncbi:CO or xanthine dehydrogenase, FAD-binding subunit [Alkalispirochaeta americana]|uniref:CO or xanthine dehydrogenase, FAD-binding subunit n=1 Tax=Alkalispirochaeta americana TaxID=159291 RepID=A0A1N6U4P9_9SPIO|nr:FAD binding domain-containing protein [Alkalispirochaeta americana]SIQ60550.1 CO or xanthine dehydrogenase, FAD-binding subunit [Alkalispirochaeta americana]